MQNMTPRHEKILSAAASHGVPLGYFPKETAELVAAGRLSLRETRSKVGAVGLRYFLAGVA